MDIYHCLANITAKKVNMHNGCTDKGLSNTDGILAPLELV